MPDEVQIPDKTWPMIIWCGPTDGNIIRQSNFEQWFERLWRSRDITELLNEQSMWYWKKTGEWACDNTGRFCDLR